MKFMRHLAHAVGSPLALSLSVVLLASGLFFGFSESWWTWLDRAVYLATLWIAIIVQATANRDTIAMQRKLDELIHAIDKADDHLEGIEEKD